MVELKLAWCSFEAASYACRTWHYSCTIPAGKLIKVGVWEGGRFIGAVVFGRGANNNIGSRYGLAQTEVCELVRIALNSHVTPVSRIAALAVRMLRRNSPGLRLIVSYADPKRGHHGGIYQAGNWTYAGPSGAQRELIVNGAPMHKRSANSRWGTASPKQLTAKTGLRVEYGQEQWKHTYLLPLDAGMRSTVAPLARPYPKRSAGADGGERTSAEANCTQAA